MIIDGVRSLSITKIPEAPVDNPSLVNQNIVTGALEAPAQCARECHARTGCIIRLMPVTTTKPRFCSLEMHQVKLALSMIPQTRFTRSAGKQVEDEWL